MGIDSPVIMLSSTAEAPSITFPSVAILSPGRTTKLSPKVSSSIGICFSIPLLVTETVFAPRFSSAVSAALLRDLARASK